MAPVKAPRLWPKSWLLRSDSVRPAQFTAMKGLSLRWLEAWIARADELLTRPGFALDQHGRVYLRQVADLLVDLLHGFALSQ